MGIIGDLPIGSLVKDLNSTYYGVPIKFMVLDHNHTGYPVNSTTMISNNIIKYLFYDGKESLSGGDRATNGNNNYKYSNLRQWLNKDCTPWWVASHAKDAPPSAANAIASILNDYESQIGFLANLSTDLKGSMLITDIPVVKPNSDGGSGEIISDYVFLLSKTEIGFANEVTSYPEGTAFSYFNSNERRICTPTDEAKANSHYTISSTYYAYWLRTPTVAYDYFVWTILSSGILPSSNGKTAYDGRYGIRPVMNITSDTLVSDTQDVDGAYILFSGGSSTPISNIQVNVNGVIYKNTQTYVNVGGLWKPSEVYVNVGGVWKK